MCGHLIYEREHCRNGERCATQQCGCRPGTLGNPLGGEKKFNNAHTYQFLVALTLNCVCIPKEKRKKERKKVDR